jgi:hypothetical protein
MKVLILSSQDGDWEGLFIDGNLIDESETLGEGASKTYLLEMSERYNFSTNDVSYLDVNDDDNEELMLSGNFPTELSELSGEY